MQRAPEMGAAAVEVFLTMLARGALCQHLLTIRLSSALSLRPPQARSSRPTGS